MFSYSELNAVELSTTKKDYYQIWNELLEVAQKLSERWDPTATNEADPGIVLLKVATALADKINYAVDANTLEAFMPSCAQEASMRKLCDMLGYSMSYYRSATSDAKIICKKAIPVGQLIHIDKFSSLKDIDNKVNYLTLEEAVLSADTQSVVVPCIEGELVDCETDDNNVISLRHLDDNFRYYLPETAVAENGIFVTNLSNDGATASFGSESLPWQQVSNLNTVSYGTKVYKFGFDSRLKAPYLQFPDDVSSLIDDGLRIRFIRSRGVNGNIAVNTLSKLEKPLSWSATQSSADTAENPLTEILNNMENFAVSNIIAARNGRNPEGINSAYKNFQKTIGTFDTLVTCRDYMNKIYQMTSASSEGNHLVSNVIVSDIKDDINRAFTLTTLGDFGVETKSVSKTKIDLTTNKAVDRITHFDLILYPFTALVGTNTKLDFENSFKYSNKAEYEILQQLEQNKLLSHNIIIPPAYSDRNDLRHSTDDIACIRASFKLDARITTTKKVMATECAEIEQIVHKALYTAFNMRQMTFGEELPYDEILHVIETADPRIKNVILDDPRISFKAVHLDGTELEILDSDGNTNADALSLEARDFNKLVLANVLAGRIALFNYDLNFETRFDEKAYPAGYLPPDADFFQESESGDDTDPDSAGGTEPQAMAYPIFSSEALNGAEVSEIETELKLFPQRIKDLPNAQLVLGAGEVIQFRAPNFRTVTTYPAYINYYFQRNAATPKSTPAKMVRVLDWLRGSKTDSARFYAKARVNNLVNLDEFEKSMALDAIDSDNAGNYAWELVTQGKVPMTRITLAGTDPLCGYNVRNLDSTTSRYGALFTKSGSGNEYTLALGNLLEGDYYYPELASTKLNEWTNALKDYYAGEQISSDRATLYKASSLTYAPGELVDAAGIKYTAATTIEGSKPLTSYALPEVAAGELQLGKELVLESIPANADYALKSGEYLFIDYESAENASSTTTRRISKVYGQGTIIRPNFALSASSQVNTLKKEKFNKDLTSGTSWTKASDGSPLDSGSVVLPSGLYTLSTQEQIEIREPVQVKIQSVGANIYWERKNEDMLTRADDAQKGLKRAYFFPEGVDSYTLQEGEYFYYTDTDKLDMAYYGCGTEIRRFNKDPKTKLEIFKSLDDANISAAEIDELGLTAAIPWRPLDTSKGNLTIIEYQYTKLVEGDTLRSVQVRPDDEKPALNYIGNEPVKVETASIICGGTAQELAPILIDDFSWEMFTRLELDIGPTKTQTLRTVYNTASQPVLIPRVTLLTDAKGRNKLSYSPLTSDSASVDALPLTLRASHTVRSLGERADASRTNFIDPSKPIRDLVVKACQQETLHAPGGALLNLNNMLDKFTTVSFIEHYTTEDTSESPKLPKAFTLHNIVPENHYNLIALYYNPDPAAEALDSAFGDIVDGKAPDTRIQIALSEGVPEIFNLYTGHDTTGWWRDEALVIERTDQDTSIEAIRSAIVDRTDEALTEETTQINYIYPDQVTAAQTPGLYDLTYHAYVSDFYLRDFKVETLDSVKVPEDAITCRVPIPTGTNLDEITLVSTEEAKTKADNQELYAIIDPQNGKIEVKHASKGQNFVVNFALKSTGRALTTLGDSNILDLVKVVQHNLVPILKSGGTSAGPAIDVTDPPYYSVQAEYTLDPDLYAKLTLEDLSNDTLDLSQIQGLPIEVTIKNVPVVNIGLRISQVVAHKQYVLRPGLNIIKLVSSCDINFYARQGSLDTLLFGSPSAIPVDDSKAINPRLGYVGGLARALKDIRELDTEHQFFYNTPIDTSAGLDLNLLDTSDGLTLPSNWFDANNIVNKFVISKIDADYLTNHVVVSKFSRR